jgi:hypothetical protein
MIELRRAADAGFRLVDDYRDDPDLNPLRDRADFRALLLGLEFPADPFAPRSSNRGP